MLEKIFLSLILVGAVGVASADTNLIANPDMSIESGVLTPLGWSTMLYPDETGGRIWAEPLSDGAFELNVRGRKSTYLWQQNGLTLVPGAKYRYSCEIKTAGAGSFRLFVRNKEWSWERRSEPSPVDTKGVWAHLSVVFVASETKFPSNYSISLAAKAGTSRRIAYDL